MTVNHPIPAISLDFSYFDNLYSGHEDQYAEMLDLYLQEYSIYKKTITAAIAEGNLDEFRKAKHKIIYSLHLLKLESIKEHLDQISQRMSNLVEAERIMESKMLNEVFEDILGKLVDKKTQTH